jgi:hypothetical protein
MLNGAPDGRGLSNARGRHITGLRRKLQERINGNT